MFIRAEGEEIARHPRYYGPVLGFAGVLYTIPSLALFAVLVPFTGLSLLTAEMQRVAEDPRRHAQLAGEARRLMLPGEMGEIFKVIALGHGYDRPLAGFGTQNLPL